MRRAEGPELSEGEAGDGASRAYKLHLASDGPAEGGVRA